MGSQKAGMLLVERARACGQPRSALFELTTDCHCQCLHCYRRPRWHVQRASTPGGGPEEPWLQAIEAERARAGPPRPELGFDEATDVLAQLAEAGVLFLAFTGGEVFARPDAEAILARAHELGFALRVKTTGYHIDDGRARVLARLRPLAVELSVYSADPAIHDRITRKPGSWARSIEATRALRRHRVKVQLSCPVMELSAGGLGRLVDLARHLDTEVSFDPRLFASESSGVTPVRLRMRAATLREFYRATDTGVIDLLCSDYGRLGAQPAGDAEQRADRLGDRPVCGAGDTAITITSRGLVVPCTALDVPCGDLRQQSFASIWSDAPVLEALRGLRREHLSECRECALWTYCSRCHGMALFEDGDLRGPSLEACRHAVAVRDALCAAGVLDRAVAASLPPTWPRVNLDGQHDRGAGDSEAAAEPANVRTAIARAGGLDVGS